MVQSSPFQLNGFSAGIYILIRETEMGGFQRSPYRFCYILDMEDLFCAIRIELESVGYMMVEHSGLHIEKTDKETYKVIVSSIDIEIPGEKETDTFILLPIKSAKEIIRTEEMEE